METKPTFQHLAVRPADHKEIKRLAGKTGRTIHAFVTELIKSYKSKKGGEK